MRNERDPVRVGALLGRMIEREGWRERLAVGRLRKDWPAVVGPHIASRSLPGKIAGGVLTVYAESGPWATELALLAGQVAAKSDAFLGGGLVREVKVVAARGRGAAERR